jgi:hypothetical protein
MPAYQPSAGSSAEANISSFPGQGMYDPSSFLQVLSKNSNILKYFSVKSHQGRSPFQPAITFGQPNVGGLEENQIGIFSYYRKNNYYSFK